MKPKGHLTLIRTGAQERQAKAWKRHRETVSSMHKQTTNKITSKLKQERERVIYTK